MSSGETNAGVKFITDFAFGGVSLAIGKTCNAPIQRVKILLQTQDANPRIMSGEIPRYTGITNCFSRVYSEQGIYAFWRGNFPSILGPFFARAFSFASKDAIKRLFPKANPKTEFGTFMAINMASGGLAGATTMALVYPLGYARTRLAADVGPGCKRDFNGLWDCLKKTASGSPRGFWGLYNGFGVSVAGIFPYRAAYFGLYDTAKDINPYKENIMSKFFIAQSVAITAGYASYPFDTVCKRLQMQSEKPREQWIYRGATDCFRKILRNEGGTGFFKGAGINLLGTIGSAMVLVLYDVLPQLLWAK